MHFFSSNWPNDTLLAICIAGTIAISIWVSNIAFDKGMPNYLSRKIGHIGGGFAFLIAYAVSASGWPIIIAFSCGALFIAARAARPQMLRGVGGSGRTDGAIAEVWFPWIAVPVYLVSWLWLELPAIALACLLFMAWGDAITGLVRSGIYHRAVKGLWGSVAMLGTCLLISWFFIRPFWIGVAASVAAVIVERIFGKNGTFRWGDDNWAIPLASLVVILGLMASINYF